MAVIKKFKIKSYEKVQSIIELKNISVFYNKRQIIENLNLSINKQEILGMLGPNGVGKSTIFNLITGLKDPNYGEVIIDGINVTNLPINEKVLIPVSFDNFSNRKDAVIALRKFQNSDNKDAWIFDVE